MKSTTALGFNVPDNDNEFRDTFIEIYNSGDFVELVRHILICTLIPNNSDQKVIRDYIEKIHALGKTCTSREDVLSIMVAIQQLTQKQ